MKRFDWCYLGKRDLWDEYYHSLVIDWFHLKPKNSKRIPRRHHEFTIIVASKYIGYISFNFCWGYKNYPLTEREKELKKDNDELIKLLNQ